MSERPTRSEITETQAQELFSGRRQVVSRLRRNLNLPPNDPNRKLIWMVYGEGGIGKTTLLEHYQTIVKNRGYATAWVDEESNQPSIVATMGAIAEQLGDHGHHMKPFMAQYTTYRKLMNEIEKDPEAPSGLSSMLGRAAGFAVVTGLKMVLPPGAGDAVAAFGSTIMEISGEASDFLFRKYGKNRVDEVRLILEPVKLLTPLFVQSLSTLALDQPIALFIDTYEKAGTYLDGWLCDLLRSRYGDLASEVFLVMAGRYELAAEWLDLKIQPFLEQVALGPFTEQESREYLKKRKINDPNVVEEILKSSERVPGYLANIASQYSRDPKRLWDPANEIIDRFLKWVPDEKDREAILTCIFPRQLNLDVVEVLLGQDQPSAMYNFIAKMSFVRQRKDVGLVYERFVRELMLRQRRQESPRQWREIHTQLANYYASERDALSLELKEGLRDEGWQYFDLEWLYHTICALGRHAVKVWVGRIFDVLENLTVGAYNQKLSSTIKEAGEILEEAEIRAWGERIASLSGQTYADLIPLLDALVEAGKDLPPEREGLALRWRGWVYLQQREFSDALVHLERAVELRAQDSVSYALRGVAHMGLGDYITALHDLDRALELQPEYGNGYLLRGQLFLSLGDKEKAMQDWERAIDLGIEDAYFPGLLGIFYLVLGDIQKALEDFDRAIELQPQEGQVYLLRGAAHLTLGNHAAALADMNRGVEIESHPDSFLARAIVYYTIGDLHAALDDVERGLESQPQNGVLLQWRGRINLARGKSQHALVDINRAIELLPETATSYFLRCQIHLNMGDRPAARADLERAAEAGLGGMDKYIAQGINAFVRGQWQAAVEAYTQAIDLQPGLAYGYSWRGQAHAANKNHEAAISDFNRAIELQPQYGDNYFRRGQSYLIQGDRRAALADLDRAIELLPESGRIYLIRAIVFLAEQNREQAIGDLNRAVERGLEGGDKYAAQALVNLLNANFSAALSDFSQAIELQPESGIFYFFRGITQLALGEQAAAQSDLQYAAELGMKLDDHPILKAINQLVGGDPAKSLSDLDQAIQQRPEEGMLYSARASVYLSMQKFSAALDDINRAIELRPELPENYFVRATALTRLEEYSDAIEAVNRAIEFQPHNGMLFLLRAQAYQGLGDFAAALADLNRASELPVSNVDIYIRRGLIYMDMRKYQAAIDEFASVLELQPENSNIYFFRGLCYQELREHAAAVSDFDQTIRLQPEEGYNYYSRALNHRALEDYDSALADFNQAIALQPEEAHNYRERGRCYQEIGDYDSALADLNHAIELEPDSSAHYLFRSLFHLDAGDYVLAVRDLDASIEHEREEADTSFTLFWRGVAHDLVGQNEEARNDWERASAQAQVGDRTCEKTRALARLMLIGGDADVARESYHLAAQENLCSAYDLHRELIQLERLQRLFPGRADIQAVSEWFVMQMFPDE